ncbi:MAG TPA: hypothetical protein VK335_00150 [Bryobacteraceae bacterium]|nr:hypothetical protein [Bryobacteraceae bacterium]
MIVTIGRYVFTFAIVAVGVETWVIARQVAHPLGPQYGLISVLPWLPAIPWVAYVFGAIWICCGVGLLFERTVRMAALVLGTLLFLCALILDAPKSAVDIGDVSLRTTLFEPLSIACLAWLAPSRGAIPDWLARGSRYLLAASLIIFGVDHFIVLAFIATLIPAWIPWPTFWSAFFGVAFSAAGLSIGLNWLPRAGAIGIGLMFGIWVVTLHVPRVLGLYGIPGAPTNPDEWSSLFIAVALWGGPWAMARSD